MGKQRTPPAEAADDTDDGEDTGGNASGGYFMNFPSVGWTRQVEDLQLEPDVPGHWMFMARFGPSVRDQANLRFMRDGLLARLPEREVAITRDQHGHTYLAVAVPYGNGVMGWATNCRAAMADGQVLDDDLFADAVQEAIAEQWARMELPERVRLCLTCGEPVALAREGDCPPELSSLIEDRLDLS